MSGRVPLVEPGGSFLFPLVKDRDVEAGNRCVERDRLYDAIGHYNKALSKTDTPKNRAAINYNLAVAWYQLAQKQNDPSIKGSYLQKAREHILKAFQTPSSIVDYTAGLIDCALAEFNLSDSSWLTGKYYLGLAKELFISVLQKTALDPKQKKLHQKAQYNLETADKKLDELLKRYTNGIKIKKQQEKPKTPDAKKEAVHKFNRALYKKTMKELAKTIPREQPKESVQNKPQDIKTEEKNRDLPRPKIARAKPASLGDMSASGIRPIVDGKSPNEGEKLFGYISPNRYVLLKTETLDRLTVEGITKSRSLPLESQGARKELSFTVTLYADGNKTSLLNHLNGEIDGIKFYGPDGKETSPQYTLEKGQSQETKIVFQEKFKGIVVYKIYKTEPEKSAGVGKQYTQPAPFTIDYSADLEAELQKLDKLPIAQKITGLKYWIKTNLKYDESEEAKAEYLKNSGPTVNFALRIRKVDCDVANTVFIAILRSRYGIPARLARGFMVSDGNIRDPFHAWAEVFYDGRWHTEDATPPATETSLEAEAKKNYTPEDYYKLRAEVYRAKDSTSGIFWEFSNVAGKLGRNYLDDAFVVLKEQANNIYFDLLLNTVSSNSQLIDYFNHLEKKYRSGKINKYSVMYNLRDAIYYKRPYFNPNLDLVRKFIAGWSPLLLRNIDKLGQNSDAIITVIAFSQNPTYVKALWNWMNKNKFWRGIDNLLKFNPAYAEKGLNLLLDVMSESNAIEIIGNLFNIANTLIGKPEHLILEERAREFYNKAVRIGNRKYQNGYQLEDVHPLLEILLLAPYKNLKIGPSVLVSLLEVAAKTPPRKRSTLPTFDTRSGGLLPAVEFILGKLALFAHDQKVLKALAKNITSGSSSRFSENSIGYDGRHWDNEKIALLGKADAKAACLVLEARINFQLDGNRWPLDNDKKITKESLLLLQQLSLKDKSLSRNAVYSSLKTMQQLLSLGIEVEKRKEIADNLVKLLKKSGAKLEEIMAFIDYSAENFTKMHISSSEFTFWSTLISQLLKMIPSDKQYLPIRKMWDKLKQYPKRLRALLPTISGLNYSYFIRAANGGPERKFYDENLEYEVEKACRENFGHFSTNDKLLLASRFLAKSAGRIDIEKHLLSLSLAKDRANKNSFFFKEILTGQWGKASYGKEVVDNLTAFALYGLLSNKDKRNFISTVESKFGLTLNISNEERKDINNPRDGDGLSYP